MFKYFKNGLIKVGEFVFDSLKYFFKGIFLIITALPRFIILSIQYIFSKKKRDEIKERKKNNKKPLVPKILLLCSLTVYFMCVYVFFRWSVQTLKIESLNNDIIEFSDLVEEEDNNALATMTPSDGGTLETDEGTTYVPSNSSGYSNVSYLNVDFSNLLEQNSDTVGWIKVEGTKVNYSVVQGDDNDFYLDHDFYKNPNSAGWIFADWRGSLEKFRRNTVIYGHNMNNKTMFGSLPSTLFSSSWQNNPNNHFIKLSTPSANSVWKIFSVYVTEPRVDYLRTVFTDSEYKSFINDIQSRSVYNFNTDVSVSDYIITLSTCDDTGRKRMVTHAKMIKYQPR